MLSSRHFLSVCGSLLIVGAVLAVYSQVAGHQFVLFDDTLYVTDNYFVLGGLTWEGIRWAATSVDLANWHPLTLVSHMVDVEVWGLRAGGHALTNVVLHALASVLLFGAATALTGRRIAGLFVAVVFAVHPANVESVAWIAQRKSVLCAVFWFATILAYLRYVARPGPGWYATTLAAFTLALMSKAAAVTLPFVLLLLDLWPLGRLGLMPAPKHFAALPSLDGPLRARARRLLAEKLPLLIMSALASGATYLAQKDAGALTPDALMPLPVRAANAAVGVIEYLRMFAAPGKLAVFYPLTGMPSAWGASVVVLVIISGLALVTRRRVPGFLIGWLMFLGTLVPMSGLVQVGAQRIADRYLYLPMVGLALAVAWMASPVLVRMDRMRWVAGCVAISWLGWLGFRAHEQVRVWENDATLAEQTESTEGMPRLIANNAAIDGLGRWTPSEVEAMLTETLTSDAIARYNLGVMLLGMGRIEEAIPHIEARARVGVVEPRVHYFLARAYVSVGRVDEARTQIDLCRSALPQKPQWRNSTERIRAVVCAPDFRVESLIIPQPDAPGPAEQTGSVPRSQG